MSPEDKLRVIKTLKQIMVRKQQWEFCTWLRDLERGLEGDLKPVISDVLRAYIYSREEINARDYHHILELISTFSSEWKGSVNSEVLFTIVTEEFINVIRQIKLDQIL